MSAQLVSVIVMFFAGVMVGAVIDAVRILFSKSSRKSIVYKLSHWIEIVFWLGLGMVTFYFLFLVKNGEWRVLDPLAQIAGIFAYDLFFQRSIRFIGRIFVNILIRPFMFVGYIFVWIIKQLVRNALYLARSIGKIFKKNRKQV